MARLKSIDYFRLGLTAFLVGVFAYAAIESTGFSRIARYFPLIVSLAGLVLSLLLIILEASRIYHGRALGRSAEDYEADDEGDVGPQVARSLYYLVWIFGYFGIIYIAGVTIATAVFLASFLLIEASLKVWTVAAMLMPVLVGIWALTNLIGLRLPPNLFGL